MNHLDFRPSLHPIQTSGYVPRPLRPAEKNTPRNIQIREEDTTPLALTKRKTFIYLTIPRLPPHSLPASQMDLLVKRPRTVRLPQPLTRVQPLPLLSISPITRDTLSPSWNKKPYHSPFTHLPFIQPLTRTPPLSPLPLTPLPSYSDTPQSIPP